MASLVARAKAGDRAALRKALANPGLRSKLPDKYLKSRPDLLRQRRLNTRLNAPVTPGSTMTERELAHAAESAAGVKYGPLEAQQARTLGEAQTYQRDIGGFYDAYQRQVAQNAANVQAIGAQAQQAVQNLQAGVTGLAGQDFSQLQQQANQGAAARGVAPAADLSQIASNAAAVRQALVGSFAAQQAAQNAAQSGYAGTLANVVAPGQKIQGVAQAAGRVREAREKQEATAREKGAYGQQYRAEQRAAEAKNILAQQIASGKSAAELAKAQLQSSTQIKTTKIRAGATLTAAKMRNEMAAADRAAKAGEPNKYGIPADQWRTMSTAERQKTIRDFAGGKGKGAGGKGPDWLPQGQAGAGLSSLPNIERLMRLAKGGKPFIAGHRPEPKRDRYASTQKIMEFAGKDIKDPALVRAVADKLWDGHLSAYTTRQLIAAGYKPSRVAATLGIPTHMQAIATTRANTKAYRGQRNLGRTGHM